MSDDEARRLRREFKALILLNDELLERVDLLETSRSRLIQWIQRLEERLRALEAASNQRPKR